MHRIPPAVPLGRKKLFLLDLDGTLYLDTDLFPGTLPFLRQVLEQGGRYLFLTNNSSKSVDVYVDKLARMGVPARPEDFLTSVDATAAYLHRTYPGRIVYVLGTESFGRQLAEAGISVTRERNCPDIAALVMGFDTELTFGKLEDACILLGRGVGYVAANPDLACPTAWGYVPDCGSVAQMLRNATGRDPVFIGKPEPAMVEMALERMHVTREETVLVGDRVYTDIACGIGAGVDTVMVLSGEGTVSEAEARGLSPTWILEDISAVTREMQSTKPQ